MHQATVFTVTLKDKEREGGDGRPTTIAMIALSHPPQEIKAV